MSKPAEETEDQVEAWVRRLNQIGGEMDEWCAATHPSAWDEMCADGKAEFRRVVAAGPQAFPAKAKRTSTST